MTAPVVFQLDHGRRALMQKAGVLVPAAVAAERRFARAFDLPTLRLTPDERAAFEAAARAAPRTGVEPPMRYDQPPAYVLRRRAA